MPQETRRLTDIQVGARYRSKYGDFLALVALANSMKTLGLLHPVVITPENQLIAGARRLQAAKMLKWSEIPVRVLDVPSLLQAEHDENELREAFTVVERARIGLALEKEIAAKNAEKMREAGRDGGQHGGRGKKKKPLVEDFPRGFPGQNDAARTISQVGHVIGMSGKTYAKARAVLKAADEDPEKYGWIADVMELKGNVGRAYHTLKAEENKHATADPETPPPAPPAPRIADRLSKDVLEICQIMDVLNALLKARNEAFMIQLVQLSQVDLETVGGLFTITHALTGVWLDEIIAALKGETDDQT